MSERRAAAGLPPVRPLTKKHRDTIRNGWVEFSAGQFLDPDDHAC